MGPALAVCHGATAPLMCSLFKKTTRINNGVSGSSSPDIIDQFKQARLVTIAHRRFTIRLHPVGVLQPKIVMDLLPEFLVRVDLM